MANGSSCRKAIAFILRATTRIAGRIRGRRTLWCCGSIRRRRFDVEASAGRIQKTVATDLKIESWRRRGFEPFELTGGSAQGPTAHARAECCYSVLLQRRPSWQLEVAQRRRHR